MTRIDIVFDVPEQTPYYQPTIEAVQHASSFLDVDATISVVRTDTIDDGYFETMPDAVVIGPGTPYTVPSAAERVILTARERGVPLVGT